ncbi:hypothetical protein L7F22_014143 [Adiantum nelumboides]|nr:hypothetical protein [Adiantum nelumboides]
MSTPSSGSKSRRKSNAGTGDSTPHYAPPSRAGDGALIFPVVEIDSRDGDFGATLWMPPSAMLSASLSASQLVYVTIYPQGHDAVDLSGMVKLNFNGFGHCELDVKNNLKDVHGNFCVIASAWPSEKLKEGIRVSKQLAYALGCLDFLPWVHLKPVSCPKLNLCKGSQLKNTYSVDVEIEECKELFLKLSPMTSEDVNVNTSASLRSPSLSGRQQGKTLQGRQGESPSTYKSRNTAASNFSPVKDASHCSMQPKEHVALTSILGDKDSSAFKLLECLAGRLLHGRYLLRGNRVGISVCGHEYIFEVADVIGQSNGRSSTASQGSSKTSVNKESDRIFKEMVTLFCVGSKTLVKFQLPGPAAKSGQSDLPGAGAIINALSKECVGPSSERLGFSAIGGLSEQISILKEIITFSLLRPECLFSLGLQPPRGVLLYGPPGTGKTSLALASATETGIQFFPINGPEIVSEYYGESEASLREVFAAARAAAPAVVFIDELDAIAPQRTEGSEHLGQRMVATLLTIMDGGNQGLQGVLVIAATNRLETIDPALRRPGRFDREIEIGVPSPSGRVEILTSHLDRMSHALAESEIKALAAATHGFVGADLSSLCNEAALVALRNFVLKNAKKRNVVGLKDGLEEPMDETESQGTLLSSCTKQLGRLTLTPAETVLRLEESLKITINDFEEAKTKIRPSAMREVMLEVPKVRWSDVGGHEDIKQQLQEAVEWPQKHMDAFVRIGTLPPKGVLLYGPPGCSKTLMARAVATEAELNFIAVKGPELFSKWVGESEKAVRSLFQRARLAAPSVIFFDELDGLAVSRESGKDGVSVGDRVMSQLLVEMDGMNIS